MDAITYSNKARAVLLWDREGIFMLGYNVLTHPSPFLIGYGPLFSCAC